MGKGAGDGVVIVSTVSVEKRAALEQLLFFNVNQHRVRLGIQQSIETYGVPEICERDGGLSVRVGEVRGVQTLFAVSDSGKPLGVAVYVRSAHERDSVLHVVIDPRLGLSPEINTRVLLKLMHAIRRTARSTDGIGRIELVYKDCDAARLHG